MRENKKERLRDNIGIYLLFLLIAGTIFVVQQIITGWKLSQISFVYYLLILVPILFVASLIVAWKKTTDIAIASFLIPFFVVGILVTTPYLYGAYSHAASDHYSVSVTEASDVYVYNASKIPDNYTRITERKLDEYPNLKKALKESRSIELTSSEFNELDRFLTEYYHGRPYIKYKGEYYMVDLTHSTA
jgi:hypothetical protein